MSDFYTLQNDKATLHIRLTPSAAKNAIGGLYTDANNQTWLKASVTTIPEKGKANKALIDLLSKTTKTRKTAFTITSGETDRHKTITLDHADEGVINILKALMAQNA